MQWCALDWNVLKKFSGAVELDDSSSLECFKNMDKEAINYETTDIQISAHMFLENAEVQQKCQSILNHLAFKSGQIKSLQDNNYI